MVNRSDRNPIITPADITPYIEGFEVICAFNAGIIRYQDEILMMLRVAERPRSQEEHLCLAPYFNMAEKKIMTYTFDKSDKQYDFSDSRVVLCNNTMYLTSISYLRLARSRDGIHFTIEEKPALFPEKQYEIYGLEDPRITQIDDTYYINYSAISPEGISTVLTKTQDFVTYEHIGIIMVPDNKDVVIFPEKINGRYYALHRPNSGTMKRNDIWIADSPDLVSWGHHKLLMGSRPGMWDGYRIGSGMVPFRVPEGWLEIYHGATTDNVYCLGAVLLKADDPSVILGRCRVPILSPETDYEKNGFFGNVVFSCGGFIEDQTVKIYYGAADTSVAYAEIQLSDIMNTLE